MPGSTHRGGEHLIFVRDQGAADEVAAELRHDGFADVEIGRPAAQGQQWEVRLRDDRLPEASGGGAYEGLRDRFTAMAHRHGGRYDEPGDPRPPG